MQNIKLENKFIGPNKKPFIIAEMSGNHNQSLERALEIVRAVAETGADALKLQTYTADTMTLDHEGSDFKISDSNSLWKGKSLYELYYEAHTPWDWHKPIFELGRSLGLIVFSSPFDSTSVDFLETLNVPCYKIASFEITDLSLIEYVASKKKPMIMSTGMATNNEIRDAVNAATSNGCSELILLKCTSAYPATAEDANLNTIVDIKKNFKCNVGLSDHTKGIGVAVASIVLGASVIEKHFTLDRNDGGVDSEFSMEPDEMKQLVDETQKAWSSLGDVSYGPTKSEENSLRFRRSLYIVKDLQTGDILSEQNIKSIRPGYGIAPKYLKDIIGKKVTKNIKKGTAFNWKLIR